ncbi:MAG: carboxymuconolactone decarboxylase family protein [Thermodesulfobacteriota bacterium]
MDERTRLLVSLGAAVAANCVPCFEHFLGKTNAAGLTSEEILDAVEVGDQVKNGARISTMTGIRGMMAAGTPPRKSNAEQSCCG